MKQHELSILEFLKTHALRLRNRDPFRHDGPNDASLSIEGLCEDNRVSNCRISGPVKVLIICTDVLMQEEYTSSDQSKVEEQGLNIILIEISDLLNQLGMKPNVPLTFKISH
jgi:hypothetical protein